MPRVASGHSISYTPPSVDQQLSQAGFLGQPLICITIEDRCLLTAVHPVVIHWSEPFPLNQGCFFLHLDDDVVVKVDVDCECMVHHVTLSCVGKAGVTAVEVSSRLATGVKHPEIIVRPGRSSDTGGKLGCDVVSLYRRRVENIPHLRSPSRVSWSVTGSILCDSFRVMLYDDTSASLTRLLYADLDKVLSACYPVGGVTKGSSYCLALCVSHMQIENPLASTGCYDFPVVASAQSPPIDPPLHHTDPRSSPKCVPETLALMRSDSLLYARVVVSEGRGSRSALFLDSVEVDVRPLRFYLEDSFLSRLRQELQKMASLHPVVAADVTGRVCPVPTTVRDAAALHRCPLRIRHLVILPVRILLTVHASKHVFLSVDSAPLTLRRFERHKVYTGIGHLVHVLATHYVTSVVLSAGLSALIPAWCFCPLLTLCGSLRVAACIHDFCLDVSF